MIGSTYAQGPGRSLVWQVSIGESGRCGSRCRVDVIASQGGNLVERERTFEELLDFLAREAVGEMEADRSSIFLLDESRSELWSRVALGMGEQVIRFPANRGIAGH